MIQEKELPHDLALAGRLAGLAAVTEHLAGLPGSEIRGHVAGVRSFLHDDVLRHAHAEELALSPAFARLGRDGERLRAGLVVEHDTIRDAAGTLDDLAARPLRAAAVRSLTGVLDSIGLLLDGHLRHESSASLALLEQLETGERRRLHARLAALNAPVAAPPAASCLPERLPSSRLPEAEACVHDAGRWPLGGPVRSGPHAPARREEER